MWILRSEICGAPRTDRGQTRRSPRILFPLRWRRRLSDHLATKHVCLRLRKGEGELQASPRFLYASAMENRATPIKLKDGSWGVRVSGAVQAGDRVTVRSRSGKSWEVTISRVVWTGPDRNGSGQISICERAVVKKIPPSYRPSSMQGRISAAISTAMGERSDIPF